LVEHADGLSFIEKELRFRHLEHPLGHIVRPDVDPAEAVATTRALLPSRPTVAAEHPPET
jgi:hypothetical protein